MGLRARVASRLRSSKAAWIAYNALHYRELRRNAPLYRRFGIEKPVFGTIAHRDIARPSDEVPWLDGPDAVRLLAESLDSESFPEPIRRQLQGWPARGFAVLEGFASPAQVEDINQDIERLFEQGAVRYHPLGERIMNSHRRSEPIARFLQDPELLRLLGFILGREVGLFQTISFFEGSEQAAHSDSFHMTTEPMGYLIAIWLALEDVAADSGPVYYHPGSHRMPYVMSEDLGAANGSAAEKEKRYEARMTELLASSGIEPVEFTANAGDLLIWHANLVHGGRAIERPGATRKSLVAHYFARDVLRYHEHTERPAVTAA